MSLSDSPVSLCESGLYGKLPSQGDFVVRRLPQSFVGPWDDWLQAGMAECRMTLTGTWEQQYQAAPVWRFVMAAGICGPGAWAGVIQPSVDRVGRYFPLMAAAQLPAKVDVFATLLQCVPWHDAIEKALETAFEPATAIETLDRNVERIAFPPAFALSSAASNEDTLPVAAREYDALSVTLGPSDNQQTLRAALVSQYAGVDAAGSAWLTQGTATVGPTLLLARGLPTTRQFCGMLNGSWLESGWEIFARDALSAHADGAPVPPGPVGVETAALQQRGVG